MRGGLPYDLLWTEADVFRYLSLPVSAPDADSSPLSPKELSELFDAAWSSSTGESSDRNDWSPTALFATNGLERILEWKNHRYKLAVFPASSVTAYASNLARWIIDTTPLWNRIPEFFVREETGDWVSLTKSGGCAHRWCFAKNGSCVFVIARDGQSPSRTDATDPFPDNAAAIHRLLSPALIATQKSTPSEEGKE